MNPYCSELSFTFDPLVDINVALKQRLPVSKISLEHLNPNFTSLLDSLNIRVHYIECFRRNAKHISNIHTDYNGQKEIVKINWIYGGTGSSMKWYEINEDHLGIPLKTTAHTPYVLYNDNQVRPVFEIETKNRAYLIQAGTPHQIINPNEPRYCISCLISHADTNPITMSEVQKKLTNFISGADGGIRTHT